MKSRLYACTLRPRRQRRRMENAPLNIWGQAGIRIGRAGRDDGWAGRDGVGRRRKLRGPVGKPSHATLPTRTHSSPPTHLVRLAVGRDGVVLGEAEGCHHLVVVRRQLAVVLGTPVLAQVVHAAAHIPCLTVRLPKGRGACTDRAGSRSAGHGGVGVGATSTPRSRCCSQGVPVYMTCVFGSVWNPTTWKRKNWCRLAMPDRWIASSAAAVRGMRRKKWRRPSESMKT